MTRKKEFVKFRNTGEQKIIEETRDLLMLSNDAATIRVLIHQGKIALEDKINSLISVAHPLKFSEIDSLVSSLGIMIKQKKREMINKNQSKTV